MGNPEQNAPITEDVLVAVNDAMVALHLRYHGRAPGTSRTQLLGSDMLACLMGDVYTASGARA
jgi:hypothetical protein